MRLLALITLTLSMNGVEPTLAPDPLVWVNLDRSWVQMYGADWFEISLFDAERDAEMLRQALGRETGPLDLLVRLDLEGSPVVAEGRSHLPEAWEELENDRNVLESDKLELVDHIEPFVLDGSHMLRTSWRLESERAFRLFFHHLPEDVDPDSHTFIRYRVLVGVRVGDLASFGGFLSKTFDEEGAARRIRGGDYFRLCDIARAINSYRYEEGRWPSVEIDAPPGASEEELGRLRTAATFEMLAGKYDIAPSVFQSESDPEGVILRGPRPLAVIKAVPNLIWARSFAYDPDLPSEAPGARAVLASRRPTTVEGETQVVVLTAEPDVVFLPVTPAAADGSPRTSDAEGAPCEHAVINEAAAGDDLFSPSGDDADAARGWLR